MGAAAAILLSAWGWSQHTRKGRGSRVPKALSWELPSLELLGRFSSCLNCSALGCSLPCRGKHSLISNVDNNNNQQQHMRKTDEVFYFSMTDFQRGSTSELFYQSTHKRDNEVLITHLKLPYSKFMWAALVFSFSWALYFSCMCWRIRWINTMFHAMRLISTFAILIRLQSYSHRTL